MYMYFIHLSLAAAQNLPDSTAAGKHQQTRMRNNNIIDETTYSYTLKLHLRKLIGIQQL